MAFCYGYWTELSKAGIPEISPDIFAKIAFKLTMDVHEGVPVAPALATWVFIIACVNSVYPRAYSEIPRKLRENAEDLARMLGVYVVFRTIWFASMILLNKVIRAYSPLSYAIWLWLSLIIVTLSVAAVITSAHYTHAFWLPATDAQEPQNPPESPPSEAGESRQHDEDSDPGFSAPSVSVSRSRNFVAVDYDRRRTRLGYPRPGSFNRALAYIPINSRGAEEESVAESVPEFPPEPSFDEEKPKGFLGRLFQRFTPQGPPPPPPSPPTPPPPPMSDDVVEMPRLNKRTRRNARY